ncbi:MAG: lipoyl protein ligase domain-containing protein [Planctomycetota bacterium]
MLRLLSHRVLPGPEQMALDEALLRHATVPTIRLYGWSEATLSLGYFQEWSRIVPRLPVPVPVVRRITGGGAIWHDAEVTYAAVFPAAAPFPSRTRDAYPLLHGAIHTALAAQGARLRVQAAPSGDRRYREEPRCFASPAADDLIAGAAAGKVLGSAGRQRGERILVHGSLKLASNPWDGPAVAGCGLAARDAARALETGLIAALGGTAEPGQLTATETRAAQDILSERYGDLGWVRERRGPRP